MGDGGLFEHGGGLRPLPVGAQRLAISERRVGVLRVGAIAVGIGFRSALWIRIGRGVGLGRDRTRDVGHGLTATDARGEDRHGGCRRKKPKIAVKTFRHVESRAGVRAERASNKLLTLTSG
jgi:hypothetical protein